MATPSQRAQFGAAIATFVNGHHFLATLAAMLAAPITLLATFQAVTGLLDRIMWPNDVDVRNNTEFWIAGILGAGVILAAGFILRSFWWPALTAPPLLLLAASTGGPYGSSMEEAFIGWMPAFFLISAIVCAVFGTAGTLIGRWSDSHASTRDRSERRRMRLMLGLAVFTGLAVVIAGVTRADEDESRLPASAPAAYGQWIYAVATTGDLVILGTGDGIVSLDPATQTERWHVRTGEPVMHAPTIANDRIYFGSHDTFVHAVDLNGVELWRYDMDNWIFGSPAVANGMVYVGSAAKFVALDAATGAENWTIDLGAWVEISWSEDVVDGLIYLGTVHGELIAVDAITGTEAWRYVVPSASEEGESTPEPFSFSPWIKEAPVVVDGVVYFGCGNRHVYAIDAKTGVEQWRFQTPMSSYPSPLVLDGVVYAASGSYLFALDAMDGTLIWQQETNGSSWYSPIAANEMIVIGHDRAHARMTAFDARTGHPEWTYSFTEVDYVEFTEIAVYDDMILAGTSGQGLFAIDLTTGALRWRMYGS